MLSLLGFWEHVVRCVLGLWRYHILGLDDLALGSVVLLRGGTSSIGLLSDAIEQSLICCNSKLLLIVFFI